MSEYDERVAADERRQLAIKLIDDMTPEDRKAFIREAIDRAIANWSFRDFEIYTRDTKIGIAEASLSTASLVDYLDTDFVLEVLEA